MLEWNPRLVLLVLALAAIAAMLALGYDIHAANYGW